MAKTKRQRALRQTKAKKTTKARVKPTTNFFLINSIFIALFILISAMASLFVRHKLSLLSFEVSQLELQRHLNGSPPSHLKIQSASINLQVRPVDLSSGEWRVYRDAASYVSHSSQPQDGGNIVLYAPNKSQLFGNLSQVKIGDIVQLETSDQKAYEYLIQEIKTVDPRDGQSLQPTSSEVITLFTSTGFMNSKRLVVRATPIRVPSF